MQNYSTLTAPSYSEVKIIINKLNSWYRVQQVLNNINMEIQANSITGLIGPSGCGKSTFLRCLNRLNDLIKTFKMNGTILVDGEDIYGQSTDVVLVRRKVGMVFQNPNPFPMSIYDNVAFGVKEHNKKISKSDLNDIVHESLKQANLWKEVNAKLFSSAFSLSGGQQQRLCIARVLAVKPEIILFDEPCSSLDPVSTSKIEELMLDLKKRYTIIVVTHNLGQARRISDYLVFFLDGILVEFGAAVDIFLKPREKTTEDYLSGCFG